MFDVWENVLKLRQPCLVRALQPSCIGPDGGISSSFLSAIEATLWEDIERQFLHSSRGSAQSTDFYTQDKWLTTSALQKCIRRGHSRLAQRYARSSVRLDPDHAFRRLAIIALEDAGIGNLRLVASCLAILGDKRRRQRLGDEPLAAMLADDLATSVKSRLACDLLSLVDFDKGAVTIGRSQLELSEYRLRDIVAGEHFGSCRQMCAAWLLHGTARVSSRMLPTSSGFGKPAVLRSMVDRRVPVIFHYILDRALSRCRDSLAIPYAVIGALNFPAMDWQITEREFGEPEMIGGYPCEAFDMHTRVGRGAIRRFVDHCDALSPQQSRVHFGNLIFDMHTRVGRGAIRRFVDHCDALSPQQSRVHFGNLIFVLEGGLLDRRLENALIADIKVAAQRLEVMGEREVDVSTLPLVLAELPKLTKLRRQAAVSFR